MSDEKNMFREPAQLKPDGDFVFPHWVPYSSGDPREDLLDTIAYLEEQASDYEEMAADYRQWAADRKADLAELDKAK